MVEESIASARELGMDISPKDTFHAQIEEAMERSGNFIYIIDREYRFRYISSTAARFLGRRPEEVIGKTPCQVGIPPEIEANIKGLVDLALSDRKTLCGTFCAKIKGEEPFEFDATPIFTGGPEPTDALALVFDRTTHFQERRALEAIARINDLVRSSVDVEELAIKTVSAVSGALDDDCFALVIHNGGEWLTRTSTQRNGETDNGLSGEAIRIVSQLIDGGRTANIPDASKDPRFRMGAEASIATGSILAIPAVVGERVKASLIFARGSVRPFNYFEIGLGEKIASSVAVAIKDQLTLQELKASNMERENLMAILARESKRLTSILDATPVAIGLFENDGKDYRLTICNHIFRDRALNSVPRPLEGKRACDLARSEEVTECKRMIEAAFRTGQTQVSKDYTHSNGEVEYPVQVMITPISMDPPSFLLAAVNISELVNARKQLEEYATKIETERARLQTMIESLPVGVVLVDANGKVLEANDKRTEVWGTNVVKDRIVERVHSIRAKWSNNGMPVPKDGWPITRALKYGELIKSEMIDVIRPDGRHGTLLLSAAPIHDGKGERIGAVGIQQDVTEQRQLEHDALEAKERAERYLDLLTHDIQGYNAVISGYIQLAMVKDKQGKRKDELQKALDTITASTELINTMRKIQQVEMQNDAHGQTELTSMLEEVVSDVQVIGGERTHISMDVKPECYIMASPMIREAFWNILINSVKHSEGEVHITVRQNRIYDGGREYHKFIIEDDGPGIPDDVKAKVFLRKYRGRTKAQGSGLGLYLTKMLVEAHRGRIWVEDRVTGDHTKGTRFIVHLPAMTTPLENLRNSNVI